MGVGFRGFLWVCCVVGCCDIVSYEFGLCLGLGVLWVFGLW